MHLVADVIARALVVLTGTALAAFALLWHAPGDPTLAIAMARYDAQVPAELPERIRAEAGLDAGFWNAFLAWLGPLLTGDLGNSSVTGRPVWPDLRTALGHTMPLALGGLAVGIAIAGLLAWLATRRPGGWVDRGAGAIASLGATVPQYWRGLLLILLFSVQLGRLPAMGARAPRPRDPARAHPGSGRRRLADPHRAVRHPRSARAYLPPGPDPPGEITRDHVAPHAAIPVVTVLGLELAFLLEGAVIVEVIFARPGLGSFLVEAILTRNFPKAQAVVLVAAVTFVAVNLVIDPIYHGLDPRIGRRDA